MPHGGRRPGAGRKRGQSTAPVLARRAGRAKALHRLEITAERTMLEIGRVAFVDRRGILLKPLAEWTSDEGALLEGFEIVVKNAAAGDGHTDTVHKVHLAKKLGALELLAKHFALLTERIEHSGGIDIAWKESE